MSTKTITHCLCVLSVAIFLIGCQPKETPLVSNTQDDTEHGHRHIHNEGQDHEHDHSDFREGAHEHEHEHGHRHGEPIFGGVIHPIGHSHHAKGETHYHAEILMQAGREIVMYLHAEVDGSSSPVLPKEAELLAYIGEPNAGPASVEQLTFEILEKDEGKFCAEITEEMCENPVLECVVPKVTLGGQRLSFSFKLKTGKDQSETAEQVAKASD